MPISTKMKNTSKDPPKFKVGDKVRKVLPNDGSKRFGKTFNIEWSETVYEITNNIINGPNGLISVFRDSVNGTVSAYKHTVSGLVNEYTDMEINFFSVAN